MSIIAVVDADLGECQTVRGLLASMHVESEVFSSGESFFELTPRSLACVIADVHLSDMTGLEFLRRLRADGNTAPVILLASEADVRTAVEAMRLGATDFIEKSQLDVALMRRVSQLLHTGAENA
jgi:FixJ family two-component response regulator